MSNKLPRIIAMIMAILMVLGLGVTAITVIIQEIRMIFRILSMNRELFSSKRQKI